MRPAMLNGIASFCVATCLAACGAGGGGGNVPGFALMTSTQGVTIEPAGAPEALTVTAVSQGHVEGAILLSLSNAPSGVTGSFNPQEIVSGQSSTLTLGAAAAVPPGEYELSVNGVSGNIGRSTKLALTVAGAGSAPPPPPSDGDINMTGSWHGTTTTPVWGTEQNVFTIVQSGAAISGTLTANPGNLQTPIAGMASGTNVSITAVWPLSDGGSVEYRYEGIVAGDEFRGTVKLAFSSGESAQGTFSVSRASDTVPPPSPPPPGGPNDDLTGFWTGSITANNGRLYLLFDLVHSGGSVSGIMHTVTVSFFGLSSRRVTIDPIHGTLNGTVLTIAGTYTWTEGSTSPITHVGEYRFEGTVSEGTYRGNAEFLVDGQREVQGPFSVTKGLSIPPPPLPGPDYEGRDRCDPGTPPGAADVCVCDVDNGVSLLWDMEHGLNPTLPGFPAPDTNWRYYTHPRGFIQFWHPRDWRPNSIVADNASGVALAPSSKDALFYLLYLSETKNANLGQLAQASIQHQFELMEQPTQFDVLCVSEEQGAHLDIVFQALRAVVYNGESILVISVVSRGLPDLPMKSVTIMSQTGPLEGFAFERLTWEVFLPLRVQM